MKNHYVTLVVNLRRFIRNGKKNNNIKIKTNLLLRTADLYIWLKKKIQTGYFGKIYSIDAEYLYGRKEKLLMDGEDIQKITLV